MVLIQETGIPKSLEQEHMGRSRATHSSKMGASKVLSVEVFPDVELVCDLMGLSTPPPNFLKVDEVESHNHKRV